MNCGGMFNDDYFSHSLPLPYYLLIVRGKVVDVQDNPTHLDFDRIPRATSFTVAVGITNEFGKKEIVGTIADYGFNADATVSWVTSPCDGNHRAYGRIENPAGFIKERLRIMLRMRVISDPCNLKPIIVVDGRLVDMKHQQCDCGGNYCEECTGIPF
jgi:hypothetical protein